MYDQQQKTDQYGQSDQPRVAPETGYELTRVQRLIRVGLGALLLWAGLNGLQRFAAQPAVSDQSNVRTPSGAIITNNDDVIGSYNGSFNTSNDRWSFSLIHVGDNN